MTLSHRNKHIDFNCKSINWFLLAKIINLEWIKPIFDWKHFLTSQICAYRPLEGAKKFGCYKQVVASWSHFMQIPLSALKKSQYAKEP